MVTATHCNASICQSRDFNRRNNGNDVVLSHAAFSGYKTRGEEMYIIEDRNIKLISPSRRRSALAGLRRKKILISGLG